MKNFWSVLFSLFIFFLWISTSFAQNLTVNNLNIVSPSTISGITGNFSSLSVGSGSQNAISLSPGATSSAAATLGITGTGGITTAAPITLTGSGTALTVTNNAVVGTLGVGTTISLGTSVGAGGNVYISTPNGSNIVLNPQGTANTQVLSPLSVTGAISTTANPVSGSTMGNGLSYFANLSGTITSGNTAAGAAKVYFDTASDTLGSSGLPSGNLVSDLEIDHNFGGAGFSGGRAGILVNYSQTAAIAASTTIEGIQSSISLSYSFGGTGLTPGTAAGYATALNPFLSFGSGYTDGGGGSGEEIDVSAAAGSSYLSKSGLAIVEVTGNASQGAYGDSAISIGNQYTQTTGANWKYGIEFGSALSYFPLDPAGTLIGAGTQGGTMDAAYGINLSNVTFSTASLALPGFQILGNGHLFSTQTTPPTVSSCGTSPSVAAGSTDTKGVVNVGSGATTSCTVTFNTAYATPPVVVLEAQGSTPLGDSVTTTTAGFTATFTASLGSGSFDYMVIQ